MKDIVIVGTGPAGLTAAIYAARAGFIPTIYAGLQHGGQLTTTTEVENFPGFGDGIQGPKLMEEMTKQAERFGTEIVYEMITKADFSNPKCLKLWTEDAEIECKAVIIATGATAKTLGIENEAKLMGRGVSTCATCDGFFYKGKDVAVVGGGDSAMEESSYLAKLCRKVYLIHRRDNFKASNIMLERAKKTANIEFLVPYETTELLSDPSGLTGIRVKHLENSEEKILNVDGFFMAIGHRPNSEIFKDYVDTDENGYIKTEKFTATRSKGVFAAGDIADSTFRQAITAAGLGCQAAMQAVRYLEDNHG
jgi:thioredoxin reductase (NADPH)